MVLVINTDKQTGERIGHVVARFRSVGSAAEDCFSRDGQVPKNGKRHALWRDAPGQRVQTGDEVFFGDEDVVRPLTEWDYTTWREEMRRLRKLEGQDNG